MNLYVKKFCILYIYMEGSFGFRVIIWEVVLYIMYLYGKLFIILCICLGRSIGDYVYMKKCCILCISMGRSFGYYVLMWKVM